TWAPAPGPTSTLMSATAPLWTFETEEEIRATPCVGPDLVYIGSYDNNLYALNAQSGAEVWRYRTWHHVRSSPRVYQDIVYVGSDDGHMHAIDPRTGA